MKAKLIIPAGWVRVRAGNLLRGDRTLNPFKASWDTVTSCFVDAAVRNFAFTIRKQAHSARNPKALLGERAPVRLQLNADGTWRPIR